MKFKNIKNKAKIVRSPSNSRSITDKSTRSIFPFPKITHTVLVKLYRGTLKTFFLFIFLVAATIVALDVQRDLQEKINVDSQRKFLTEDLNFWENFIAKHQDYRDAYIQTSILEYKLGDTSKARMYIEESLTLDPNSSEGSKVEQLLK
jgi:tetratricopeptide (TPR) repeat protein